MVTAVASEISMNGELLNETLVDTTLMPDAPWSGSHDAWNDYLRQKKLRLKARNTICPAADFLQVLK